ncbi:MAG: C1 family peptidase [Armatimonadetes bacterium]|nr:C1 family peptidase [Armatimonadota bacterium]
MSNKKLSRRSMLILLVSVGGLTALAQPALKNQAIFAQKELRLSAPLKLQLTQLRADIAKNKYSFTVGATDVLDKPDSQLYGEILPTNIGDIARKQAPLSRKILDLDKEERERIVKAKPALRAKIYEFNIVANPSLKKWDWRKQGKVTSIRNQAPAGTCWAFAVTAALESSWLVRNSINIDGSEQFMIAYSGAGTTSGGNRADAAAWLTSKGTVAEVTAPYTGSASTSVPSSSATPYDALAWGFVDESNVLPSVQKLKQALCEHGPITIGIYSDNNLKAYTGGVFDHVDPSNNASNHAVLLVGWDDDKGAWIVKNSWGSGWGDECDYGTEKGYFYAKYGCHNVGYRAIWVKAASQVYVINPALLKDLRLAPDVLKLR